MLKQVLLMVLLVIKVLLLSS